MLIGAWKYMTSPFSTGASLTSGAEKRDKTQILNSLMRIPIVWLKIKCIRAGTHNENLIGAFKKRD